MQPTEAKLLIVDDDVDVLSAAKLLLKRHVKQADIEKNPERLPFLVTNGGYDVILLDMNFTRDLSSGKEGFDWLDRILDIDPLVSVVLITAYGDVEMAVRGIKAGAVDFVLKPWENDKLVQTITNAYEQRLHRVGKNERGEKDRKTKTNSSLIWGTSPVMQHVLTTVERVAATDANVLILGENGTGKSQLANLLHQSSHRAGKPFVAVDLGALSENLFESELFGHVKGAFTDAREDRAGRFEEAHGGTIFLDEIGNLPLPLQAKLLSVLQERTVTRVGANRSKSMDVRLICATNMNLDQLVANRNFRQDLMYRINTIEIEIPSLRQRFEDLVPLADHFLQLFRKKYNRPVTSLSASLIKKMEQYDWPGNVRELQHAIERAVILSQGKALQPEDLFLKRNTSDTTTTTGFDLEEMEKEAIIKVLKRYNGSITDAARELGLSRAALYRRLEKYGL